MPRFCSRRLKVLLCLLLGVALGTGSAPVFGQVSSPSPSSSPFGPPVPPGWNTGAQGSGASLPSEGGAASAPTYPSTTSAFPPRTPQASPGGNSPQSYTPASAGLPPGASVQPSMPLGPAASPTAPNRDLALFEDAQIVAIVGDEVILAGDLMGSVNEILAQYKGKAPEDELKRQSKMLMQKYLSRQIETKLAYLDFLRTVPADRRNDLNEKIQEQFEESQLPNLLKHYKVDTPAQLDAKLREFGSSIRKNQRLFGERMLAAQMVRRSVKVNEEVSFDEMLAYYQKNATEYSFNAQARWEHLMTRFDKFSSRELAFQALAQMGNEVLRGAPIAAVARRSSQGFDAEDGGYNNWTNQGSLASTALDQMLFSLPVGQLSSIFSDDDGFHILRVVERREAGKIPFEEAQPGIKERIRKERSEKQTEEYIAKLKKEIYVWTIFDSVASKPETLR